MEVQMLTKKQLKTTLSVKKTKTKEVIKNVLNTPYNNTFWPELSPEEQLKLRTILVQNLPQVKTEKNNIPWSEIKDVPKADRKNFRIEYIRKLNPQYSENCNSQGLILGINDVTKSLERNCLSIVLLSSDVKPKLMVQHIIDMTVLKKLPILVIADLRKLTKKYCGISSVAMGIERNSSVTSLLEIVSCVHNMFKSISPPEEHINSNRSLILDTEEMPTEEIIGSTRVNQMSLDEKHAGTCIYLPIGNNDSRAFVPERRKENILNKKLTVEVSNKLPKKKITKYKPLKVKRLKNDSSRSRKKIKSLKKVEN